MRLRRCLALVTLGGLAAGCGSSTGNTDRPSSNSSSSSSTIEAVTVPSATTSPVVDTTGDPNPLGPLVGTQWVAARSITVGGLRPVPQGTGAGFRIGPDGTIAVNTGCNTGTGHVVAAAPDRLEVTGLTTTQRTCGADATKLEANVLLILGKVNTWQIVGTTLTLIPENISDVGLTFTAG
jgi:heat shock protein HslJ